MMAVSRQAFQDSFSEQDQLGTSNPPGWTPFSTGSRPRLRPLLLLFDLWDEDDPKKPLEVDIGYGGCMWLFVYF